MKVKSFLFCLLLTLPFILWSCSDDNENMGRSILPESDSIYVRMDTFFLESGNYFVDSCFLQNDTFLLGEVYNDYYGTTKADLLFQVTPPVGYIFPTTDTENIKDATVDSLVLYMYYKTWFGSKTSPLEFSLYEIDRQTLEYNKDYYTNLNIDDYVSMDESTLIGKRVMTSIDQTLPDSVVNDTSYCPYIRYKFDIKYAEQLFNLPAEAYADEDVFQQNFMGMYITTNYGSSTMLYIRQIDMRLFYHYTRSYNLNGTNVTDTASTYANFSANKEVRQVNRIIHPDSATTRARLAAIDTLNFIKSPAGIYTNIKIPIGKMVKQMKDNVDGKLVSINQALLKMQIADSYTSSLALKAPEYVLMLRKDLMTEYFVDKGVPSSADTTAVIGYYDSTNNLYKFDLDYLINSYVRQETLTGNPVPDDYVLDMIVMPVDVGFTTSSSTSTTYITSVIPSFKLGGAAFFNSKSSKPLKITILYSGF